MNIDSNKVSLNYDKVDIGSEILRAIAHPLRLQILDFIKTKEKTHVNAIYHDLDLEQSITSQHLAILRKADLVEATREGKFVYYTVNDDTISRVQMIIEKYF